MNFAKPKFELADVFRIVKPSANLPAHQLKAIKDIVECRTDALDSHTLICNDCGNMEISYNSCRNRACPKCGWKKQQDWILKISKNILPCKHFHTTFTIPHEFNTLFLYNNKSFTNLLFKASAKAVMDVIATKWKVKGGYTSVIHTWGSALTVHPHIHMIVPAGGMCLQTGKWKGFRKQYMANSEALSLRFRNVFMKGIKKIIKNGEMKIPSSMSYLEANEVALLDFFNKPHSKKWNVNIKKPFCGESSVIKYLGRYIHRTAISNSRILKVDEKEVVFKFKNYKSGNLNDSMKLTTLEFFRRFLHHLPEKGLARVRHGGVYGNCVKAKNVLAARVAVYNNFRVPVSILKQCYKIEQKVIKIIDSISICEFCLGKITFQSSV